MARGTQVITLIAVTGREDELPFETKADLTALWIHRRESQAAEPGPILKAASELKLPAGEGFIWIAAETDVSRAVRDYFVDTLGHSSEWIKASSYW